MFNCVSNESSWLSSNTDLKILILEGKVQTCGIVSALSARTLAVDLWIKIIFFIGNCENFVV